MTAQKLALIPGVFVCAAEWTASRWCGPCVDAQLAVVRQEEIVTVTVEMMRDGPEDLQVVSEAQPIEVGQDQNGKILASLVMVPSEAEPAT
jgi:hypothetical protein